MPYADPEKAKAVKRAYFNRRRAADRKFREADKEKCAKCYELNREQHIAHVMERRTMKQLGMA